MSSQGRFHLTRQQEVQLIEGVADVEQKLQTIAILVRACYGEDSPVAARADEILGALQRFHLELEQVQRSAIP